MPADRSIGTRIQPLPGPQVGPEPGAERPEPSPGPGQPETRRGGRRRVLWLSLGLILAIAAAAGAWEWRRISAAPAARWVTAPVTTGDIEDTVTALGNLQPKNFVDVGAQVSGQLTKIDVAVGDKVKQGDLLAEIDPTVAEAKVTADQAALASLQAQVIDRTAQLDLASKQLTRQQNLMKDEATSQDALQTAEATLKSNRAQLAALQAQVKQSQSTLAADQANLGFTKIYAPMSGTVVSLSAQQGQTINANQSAPIILRIADLDTMTVWTQVSEADVPRLSVGMEAYFTTLGDQTTRWQGKLQQIQPTPTVVNNVVLYPALFDVANPDGKLMTQMSAQVFFVVAGVKNAVTVPVAALHPAAEGSAAAPGDQQDAKPYEVRVMGPNGRPERRQVWIGVMNRVSAEVLSGLNPGDVVVIGRNSDGDTAAQGAGSRSGANRPGAGPRTGVGRLL
ncbi:MAG TPA: efflux RND transporter periplasmic adaptor subunit [Dongiaceae bacterium]|nr:efflux RND transporter periplasmic adaptor subunit [Dongiaceae bacterium]